MYNVIIAESEPKYAIKVSNYISQNYPNLRICFIAINEEEIKYAINQEDIDILIMNFFLQNVSGNRIIEYISRNNLNEFKNSVIFYAENIDSFAIITENIYVSSYISKATGMEGISKSLDQVIKIKDEIKEMKDKKRKIARQLKSISYNFSYVGTKYLSDCIYEITLLEIQEHFNLTQQIYPKIAQKYNKTINSIKTNILRATNIMYFDCDEKILSNFFGYRVIEKPKIKEIINSVIEKI